MMRVFLCLLAAATSACAAPIVSTLGFERGSAPPPPPLDCPKLLAEAKEAIAAADASACFPNRTAGMRAVARCDAAAAARIKRGGREGCGSLVLRRLRVASARGRGACARARALTVRSSRDARSRRPVANAVIAGARALRAI